MHTDILFDTNRFNLSNIQPHFINDICFGEDAAAWLRDRLVALGMMVIEPAQEDWGWYIEATHAGSVYLICIGGNPQSGTLDKNAGEWRISIERHTALWDKLTGANKLARGDAVPQIIRGIIEAEPEFRNVRQEVAD